MFGVFAGRLNTYQSADLRRGTATSIPTRFETTSIKAVPPGTVLPEDSQFALILNAPLMVPVGWAVVDVEMCG